jgi:PadR family transcriptional regulator, regulatory protein AphA
METLSATAYVILGMLCRGPKSGYEIKALVDNSTRFFWAASYGQIYPELKRLAEAGLVVGSEEPTGGRRRTVYEITADGEQELQAWLRRPPEIFETRDEGLLKLFFAEAVEPHEALEIVRTMREYHEAGTARLRAVEAMKAKAADPYPMLVLRAGIESFEWYTGWCRRLEGEVAKRIGDKEEKT